MNFLDLVCSNAITSSITKLWKSTGIYAGTNWQNYVMILLSFVLMYLAIAKKFEPLLLLPIAFGMFIVNVPAVYKILFGEMLKEFGTMKFDAVMGNPPYNIDTDIDFVDLGYKLSTNITAMIAPPKNN